MESIKAFFCRLRSDTMILGHTHNRECLWVKQCDTAAGVGLVASAMVLGSWGPLFFRDSGQPAVRVSSLALGRLLALGLYG